MSFEKYQKNVSKFSIKQLDYTRTMRLVSVQFGIYANTGTCQVLGGLTKPLIVAVHRFVVRTFSVYTQGRLTCLSTCCK